MTAVEPEARPVPPPGVEPSPTRSLTGICPYLVADDGGWRSSAVAREHRCRAVAPPAPLAAEKQRRLCLTGDYPLCATFEAARAARPVAHDRLPTLPRPLARTAPVVLDHGRLAVGLPEVRADRTTVQAILVALLVIAFAAIVLARVASGGIPAGAVESPSARIASQPAGAASAAPSHPSTSADPTAGASGAGAGASGNPGASGATQTYKVKSGDTLVGIAAKFGTTTKAIADLNGITNPASLKTGQVLKIP
jgi:LysM domain-containing protein